MRNDAYRILAGPPPRAYPQTYVNLFGAQKGEDGLLSDRKTV